VVSQENHQDVATLYCESKDSSHRDTAEAVAATAREVFGVRSDVALVEPETLPNDGKVIADERSFE
jgi:phenylacetate-CoA ligase